MQNKLAALLCALCLTTCASQEEPPQVNFHSAPYPEKLSDWGLFSIGEDLSFADGVEVYDLNMPLFSDYAHKLRTIYVPPTSTVGYHATDAFDFPVGTIVSKSFLYRTDSNRIQLDATWDGDPNSLETSQARFLETRLLVKQETGWDALPYIWRGDDAYLAISGDLMTLATSGGDLNYLVPCKNQCASCHATNHTTGDIQPIGLKARHLNRPKPGEITNQLATLPLTGLPDHLPKGASWDEKDLEHKARSYLDINCGHCHNPQGAADTSGLLLDYQDHSLREMGACKPPIAAGRGSGGFLYSIVPGEADESIMTFRLETTDPGAMMPELGRSVVHQEGLELVRDWINSLEGQCL